MLKRHSQFLESLMLLSDLLAVTVSWFAAYYARVWIGPFPLYKGIEPPRVYAGLLVTILLMWAFVFKAFGLYRPNRGGSRMGEVLEIVRATSLAVLVLTAFTFFLRRLEFSRLVFLYFWVLSIAGVTASRGLFREILRALHHRGRHLSSVLVVGAGPLAQTVVSKLGAHPELGIGVVGALAGDSSLIGTMIDGGTRILGVYQDLHEVVRVHQIDQVIVALPTEAQDRLDEVLKQIGGDMITIKVVPDLYQYRTLRGGVEEFEGLPFINLQDSPLHGWSMVAKRGLDILVSASALLILSPLMLLVALLIKLSSPGPVLFRQERMGYNGKLFTMYKFRTMVREAEEGVGHVWATRDDPRRTKIGAFLRRLSLDEFPQLLNVLKGDMSMVGPRPEMSGLIEEFRRRIPNYMLRHKTKAGITGWAQVNGWRGDTSLDRRIECDLFYIEHWSLLFDLKILWLSLWKGFIHKNAI